jgi:hypothetical protein
MARTPRKVDANQPEIVEALRLAGVSTQSLAEVGDGCPDLLCGVPSMTFILEVKMPGEEFSPRQRTWHRYWTGPSHVVRSIEEALDVAALYKRYGKILQRALAKEARAEGEG